MNKRLKLISEYIENGKGFVDVGTDHGYLPVYMAENGYSGNIIASDINSDPLQKAISNAEKAGMISKIEFFLCDGLSKCPPESVDTIVIAGMGGDVIVKILDAAEWCLSPDYKLILQPMSKPEVVRYWLVYNGFEILKELLVEENDTIYQSIVANYGGYTQLNDAELYIGKKELCNDDGLYIQQFESSKKRFARAVKEMKSGDAIPKERLSLFEDIYKQLKEMEINYAHNK